MALRVETLSRSVAHIRKTLCLNSCFSITDHIAEMQNIGQKIILLIIFFYVFFNEYL